MRAPSNLIPMKPIHVLYLCERMRPDEIEQLHAFVNIEGADGEYDPDAAAKLFLNKQGPQFTVMGADGFPVVCGGYDMSIDGVWQSWMVGSMEGWEKNWRSITKASRWLMWSLFQNGARRLQTSAIASRCQAHEWYIRGLGMKHEGVQRGAGLNGEDIHLFGILAEEF
jgi:hypothetical protein